MMGMRQGDCEHALSSFFCAKPSEPMCSTMGDEKKKAQIENFSKLSAEERGQMIKDKESEMEKLEKDFKEFVEGLQKRYQEASDQKDKSVEAVKSGGLGLLKSVHAFEKKQKAEL